MPVRYRSPFYRRQVHLEEIPHLLARELPNRLTLEHRRREHHNEIGRKFGLTRVSSGLINRTSRYSHRPGHLIESQLASLRRVEQAYVRSANAIVIKLRVTSFTVTVDRRETRIATG